MVLASIPLGLLIGVMVALLKERFVFPRVIPTLPGRAVPRARSVRPGPDVRRLPDILTPAAPAWDGPPILADIPDAISLQAGDAMLDQPASPYAYRMAALVRQLESRKGAADPPPASSASVAATANPTGSSERRRGGMVRVPRRFRWTRPGYF